MATVVETRPLAPSEEIDESPQRLYRSLLTQLTPTTIPWDPPKYVYVTPEMAQDWLDAADNHPDFVPRKRTAARVKRWQELMQTNRLVEFLPNGPICKNYAGIIMNGGNRLAAVVEYGEPVGFMIIEPCPDWLLDYFDTGDKRSLKEALLIRKRPTDPLLSAITRLAMRYEEFLFGKRRPDGWVTWGRVKDEHPDIDSFMERREYVLDWASVGKQLKRHAEIQPSAGAVFTAYQLLAWPEGADRTNDFLDSLITGANLKKGNPALTLREWARRDGYIGQATAGRREGHLLLLFNMFASYCRDSTVTEMKVARGFPMTMPYHPDGFEIAVKNARDGILELDGDV